MGHELAPRCAALLAVFALLFSVAFVATSPHNSVAEAATMPGGWTWPLGGDVGGRTFLDNTCGKNASGAYTYALGGHNSYITGMYHLGDDMPKAAGNPVYAVGSGVIKRTSLNFGGDGGAIYVEHSTGAGGKFMAVYGHINGYPTSGNVSAGQQVGKVNSNHLHFGVNPGNYNTFPSSNLGMYSCASGGRRTA